MAGAAKGLLQQLRRDPNGNAADRLRLFNLTRAVDRDAAWHACADGADGLVFWLAAYAWTYVQKRPGPDGRERPVPEKQRHVPFIPWPIQEKALRLLHHAVMEGRDVVIDKSRDMGASWLCLATLVWFWLFQADSQLLMLSRNEDYVDKKGSPKSLFWKADYLIARLPDWMRPPVKPGRDRTDMHLHNPLNHSVIDGESANANAGRGDRRMAILLDEFAAVDHAQEILAATADTTSCRLFNSTPHGWGTFDADGELRGNAFAAQRFSGGCDVLSLMWWDHPDKGRNRTKVAGADGKMRWTSPWYEIEDKRRGSRKEMAQEVDCNYLASGSAFFDLDVLQAIRAKDDLRPANYRGEVHYKALTKAAGEVYGVEVLKWAPEGGRRRLKVWCPLTLDPNTSWTRPTQAHNYVAFADIAQGQGASNSILDVWDANTYEQVAQFACADTPPYEFAHIAVAICKWFGGACGWTYLGWETNGCGISFGREVLRAQYPYIYNQRDEKKEVEPRGKNFGWTSTRDRKVALFGDLRRAVGREEVVLREEMTITEMEQVVFGPSGEPIASTLVEESAGVRANHGDRVIAAAGCVMLLRERPRAKPPAKELPHNSFGWRRQQARDARRKDRYRW